MSIDNARVNAEVWKRASLDKLRQTRAVVREFKGNLDKLCGSVNALVKEVRRGAKQHETQYDKNLDDDSDSYYEDSSVMEALQNLPDAGEQAEQVDDIKTQAGDSLEGLLTLLDEFIAAIQEVPL